MTSAKYCSRASISTESFSFIDTEQGKKLIIKELEDKIDSVDNRLNLLKNFILPGGSRGAAFCHLARTVCRRAEREIITLSHSEQVDERIIIYINRLSDYFFVLYNQRYHKSIRLINHAARIGSGHIT